MDFFARSQQTSRTTIGIVDRLLTFEALMNVQLKIGGVQASRMTIKNQFEVLCFVALPIETTTWLYDVKTKHRLSVGE
jgi:hypothetical protein